MENTAHSIGAVEGVRLTLADIQIDTGRMRANLELTRGLPMAEALTMALAPLLGRSEAHHLVETICRQVVQSGRDMLQITLAQEKVRSVLAPEEIERALDPTHYLGATNALIDRALAAYHEIQSAR